MNTNNSTISSKTYVPFKTAGVERARIDQSGNIGINTTAPSAVLDINGNTKMRGQLDISGNNIINIGSLGIGTSAPSVTLDVSGAAKIRGTLDLTSQKITNVASPTTTTDVATKSYVDVAMPIGGIIMWSGSTPPTNWGLCDGSTYGGVVSPDLRGRFVLSSGQGSGLTNRTLGQTGGAETHTLSVSEMPVHTHAITATTTSDGSHTHSVTETANGAHPGVQGSRDATGSAGFFHRVRIGGHNSHNDTLLNTANHTHSVVVNSTNSGHSHTISASAANQGGGSAHNNMTPYYVLAFIIRYQ